MFRASDFIKWALTHAKAATIPSGATLALPVDECGAEPWEYLFGSVRVMTTQSTLDQYFKNYYSKQGYTRARFDELTRSWDRHGYATDCQGLCDAYLTFECMEPTDINADMNYRNWCTDKGAIAEIDRPYVIGEALFHSNGDRMTHVGWVCGFDRDGEPLAVEARGIAYGVVVTRLDGRSWTHRGLMTEIFDYNAAEEPQEETPMEPIVLRKTSPMMQGDAIRLMQQALNALGYTDDAGMQLDEDGKCGNCTMQAVTAFAAAHAPAEPEPAAVEIKPITTITTDDGLFKWALLHKDDLPGADV